MRAIDPLARFDESATPVTITLPSIVNGIWIPAQKARSDSFEARGIHNRCAAAGITGEDHEPPKGCLVFWFAGAAGRRRVIDRIAARSKDDSRQDSGAR